MITTTLEQEKKRILAEIYSRGLMTPEEYEREYKNKYLDEYGCNSFMAYLSYVELNDNHGIFITLNDKIIKDRKKLEKKFGVKIKSLQEINKMIKTP